MESNVKLGRIFGIPIGLHWSWFLIFWMLTWSLASNIFPRSVPGLTGGQYWLLGGFSALFLFASVLAHELGHAWVALRNRVPVQRITLFIFGGVAQIGQEPDTPGKEFRITLAGPMTSLALAVVFGALYLLAGAVPTLAAPARWLAEVNLTLAVFNMLPAFPLDGGRIVRSIIWAVSRSFQKATRWATGFSQVIAFGVIGLGFFLLTGGDMANGIWLVFIGWFINGAARATRQAQNVQQTLSNVAVTEVMDRRVSEVPADLTLADLMQREVVLDGKRSFLVSERNQPVGLVTIRDIVAVPRSDWSHTPVSQVMSPWDKLVSVNPSAALSSVLKTMETARQVYVPVIEGNRMAGLLTREQIYHYLQNRR